MRHAPTTRAHARAARALARLVVSVALVAAGLASAASITVTTTADELDLIANGACSLREAIVTVNEQRANGVGGCTVVGTLGSNDTIHVPAGTFTLTREHSPFAKRQDYGDLTITRSVRLVGAGAGSTVIDGNGFRVIDVDRAGATIVKMTLRNGRAYGPVGVDGGGGALHVSRGWAVLEDVVIHGSEAEGGGGIASHFSTVTLRRTTVRDNVAVGGRGGGIFNHGILTVIDSTISGNRAQGDDGSGFSGGGGIFADGRVYSQPPTLRVINSTVSGNTSAAPGGGIAVDGPAVLDSVTVTGNSSGVRQRGGAEAKLVNTLLAGNTGADCSGTFTSFDYNLVGDASGCTVNLPRANDQLGTAATPIAPLLGALQANGGATRTHALLPGSPAIDRGAFSFDPACRAADQRGQPRPTDGTGNAIARCDVGAFEAPTVPATADLGVRIAQAPDPSAPGGRLRTTVTVENAGPAQANGARYALTVPVGSPLPALPGVDCEAIGARTFSCGVGNVPIGGVRSVTVDLEAPATAGVAQTGVEVWSLRSDPNAANDAASVGTTILAPPDDLHAGLLADQDPVGTESSFWFTAVVRNRGGTALTGVVATHALSAGTPIACTIPCDLVGSSATVAVGGMAAGESRSHGVLVVAPATAGVLTDTLTLTSPATAPHVVAASTTVLPPSADLAMELSASTGQLEPGDPFSYALYGRNDGPSRTTATFTLRLPPGASLAGTSGAKACSQSGSDVTCEFYDPLWPGAGAHARLDVVAPAATGPATAFASIVGGVPDPIVGNDTDTVTVLVGSDDPAEAADVALVKQAPAAVLPGAPVAYGLVVTNLGPGQASGIVVTDELPDGTSLLTASSECAVAGRTATCTLAELPYGASHAFELTVSAPGEEGSILNTASVVTASVDPAPENDGDSATTAVREDADVPPGAIVLIRAGPQELVDRALGGETAGVPALQPQLFAVGDAAPTLTSLSLARSGSAAGAIAAVRVYLDADLDAEAGASDTLLASGAFSGSSTVLVLTLEAPLTVPAQADTTLLVTVDLAGAAAGAPLAPLAAAIGLLALVGLRRPRRRGLALALALTLVVVGCARQPVPVATEALRLTLVDVAFAEGDVERVGLPLIGPALTVSR